MSGLIAIRITSDIEKLTKAFARQQANVDRAIAQGLNEGGDKVRTQVRKAMREQTSLIRLNSVTSRERTVRAYGAAGGASKSGIGPVGPGSLQYQIIYNSKPTKIGEFKFSVSTGKGGGVTALMWGVSRKFARSFRIKGSSGIAGLRARRTDERKPIRSFDGPDLAKEAVKGRVAETFLAESIALVPPMIEKRMARALG